MIFDEPEMVGLDTPLALRRRRRVSLGSSAALHLAVASFLMSGIHWNEARVYTSEFPQRYSVRWLRLEASDLRLSAVTNGANPQKSKPQSRGAARPAPAKPGIKTNDDEPAPLADANPATLPDRDGPQTPTLPRIFEPPIVKRPPVNQTLVQLAGSADPVPVPDIPLPVAVLWAQLNPLLPFMKLAAPAFRLEQPVRNPPARPAIDPPNAELVAANLQLASTVLNDKPVLAQLPAFTAPVRTPEDHGDQLPRPQLPPSNDRKTPSVVSIPDNPMLAKEAILIPPANQIAPPVPVSSQTRSDGSGSDNKPNGEGGHGSAGTDGQGANAQASAAASSIATGPSTGQAITKEQILANSKRIVLPKDGKFGAVVTGSSATGPYVEAESALSGKILYTVFLRVGLRKNWIMQYGLPKNAQHAAPPRGGMTEIEAPWPFIVVTPHYSALLDQEYIIVRGVLNTAGRLEQMQLITPRNYNGSELLMSTLQIWQFRPAKKDGEDTPVEVLLIIPSQET